MNGAIDTLSQQWQFHFANGFWLIAPVIIFSGYLMLKLFTGSRFRWRLLDYSSTSSQHYFHSQYELIKHLVESKITKTTGSSKWLNQFLVWSCVSLFFVSLAQPEWVKKQLQKPEKYRDIVFVVDASVSMIQRDYILQGQRIDRMTLLKGMLSRFIDQLKGDNVSIIVYADSVYTLVPLTRDHELAKTMLSRIKVGVAGRTSALGNALTQAVHEANKSSNRQRALVLLTDGTRLTGKINYQVAMELARQSGLHIYTVAIGARSEAAAEKKASGLIYDPADIQKLKAIAKHTAGKFYWAGDTNALSSAIQDIQQAERSQDKPQMLYIKKPLYQWPLLLGLLVFSGLQYFSLRQKARI
ncbi:MAG: VWA domain-containing protein [Gammaproteobacteria bacterium]|nr:VWA domain-containing protein [Gammaproteobacteria bacterium]